MEEELDEIATRKAKYEDVLDEFWGPFSQALEEAETKMGVRAARRRARCARSAASRWSMQYSSKTGGSFVGCSGYKEDRCKYIKPSEGEPERPEPVETEHKCPTCGKPMLAAMGRRGPFLGCSGYPECKTTMNLTAERASRCSTAQADRAHVREVRQADGDPRRPARAVPGLHRLSEVQERQGRGRRGQPGQADRHGHQLREVQPPMIVKKGPRGPFLAAAAIPSCRSTKPCRRN